MPRFPLIAACVFAASLVRAEEPELATTVRAGRAAADGASATRIDPRAFGAELRHAGELVALSPGAALLDFGGALAVTTVTVRGGSADQVQVLFDGVPLNGSAGGGLDLSLVPGALLGGLRVVRGADGVRAGGGALAGAVSLEPATGSRAVLTTGSLGTFGASASHAREHADPEGLLSWLVAADVRRSRGDFGYRRDPTPELSGNDAIEQFDRVNNDALLGSALVRLERISGEGRGWSALALLGAAERGLPGPIYSPTPQARQASASAVGQVRGRWRAGDAGGEVPVFLRGSLLGSSAGGLGEVDANQRSLDLGTMPTATWTLGAHRLEVRGLLGAELFHGPLHGDRARVRGGLAAEFSRPTGRFTWTAAVRADRWGDAGALLPRLGGSVQATSWLTVFANGSGGFRAPSFGELYFSGGPVVPNPDLTPERSWSADLGARAGTGKSFVSASTFVGRYADVIVYELFTGFRAKPFNVGEARVAGLELEAHHVAGPLDLTLAATLLSTTNLVPGANSFGRALPYRPSKRLVARADWRKDGARAAIEAQATGRAAANRANTRFVDGFIDLRASAGVSLGRGVWLSAEVRNALGVTDRATIDGYPLPGRMGLAHVSWEPEVAP